MYAVYTAEIERKAGEPAAWNWRRGEDLNPSTLQVERRLNAAPGIQFTLPASSNAVLDVNDAVVIARRGDDFVNGFITDEALLADGTRRYKALGALTALTKSYFPPEYRFRGWIHSARNKSRLTSGYVFRRITTSAQAANDRWDGRGVLSWGGRTGGSGAQVPVLTNTTIYDIQTEGFTGGRGIVSLAGTTAIDGVPQPPIVSSGVYESPYIDMRSFDGLPSTLDTIRGLYSEGASAQFRIAAAVSSAEAGRSFSGSKFGMPQDRYGYDLAGTVTAYAFIELSLAKPEGALPEETAEFYSVDLIGRYPLRGITAGDFPEVEVVELKAGNQTLWSLLRRICSYNKLEFREDAGGVLVVGRTPAPGEPSTGRVDRSAAENPLRDGADFTFQDFQADERALTNAVRVMGPGPDNDATVLDIWDEDSIAEYGTREKFIKISDSAVGQTDWEDIRQTGLNALALGKERRLVARIALSGAKAAENLNPGDVIRLTSARKTFGGSLLDMRMRITSDRRTAAGDGLAAEAVSLVVENAPETQEEY